VGSLGHRLGSFLIALATALGIVALVMPLFLNPFWVAFEQGRAQAPAWTGFTVTELRAVTDVILGDLVVGPPDFDVAIGGEAVLNERERAHMRDVRTVFMGFFAVTAVLVVAGVAVAVRRGRAGRVETWRSIRSGAIGLIVGLVLVGGFAFIAFDVLFEVFHQLLFPGGSYTFDPATERLVQLFPFQFWQETAIALGVAAIVVAAIVAAVAHRRIVAFAPTHVLVGPTTAGEASGEVAE
jgi:integral membrane protein (TIGR01906 family)